MFDNARDTSTALIACKIDIAPGQPMPVKSFLQQNFENIIFLNISRDDSGSLLERHLIGMRRDMMNLCLRSQ